ncbi:MAG: ISKra4 family transposase [Anaerolineae bacterium]|nr:ISKra4 family transposase [Anaerolineae bacterium]
MAKKLPDEVRKQIDQMTEAFRQRLTGLFQWSNDEETDHPPTAVEIEDKIREWIRQIGEDTQALVLGGMDRYRHKGKQCCPQCGEAVYWERYEPRNYITTLGEMQLERAYYHHSACHRGWVPMDERLGIGASELSPRVQEMLSYLGGFMPFERAQTFLAKYHYIHVSHDTVNSTTVAIGQALREQQEAAVRQAWEEYRLPTCEVATSPKHLYVSADGINYLLPNGEGKEIKLAAVYETEERRNRKGEIEIHAVDIEYVVATDPEDLARAAYLIAVKRGVESAEQIIVLGDGASWIWNRIAAMFPGHKTTEILDFYHASEYIWDAGKAVLDEGTDETKDWGEKYCHRLKHDGPAPVLRELRALSLACSTTPEPVAKAITYFENQSLRMNYPLYVEQGLQIGSGSAESGVKQVVGCRINQAGMRWNPRRAEAVAHVRAAILSGRWDDFWSDFHPPPRQYRRKQMPLAA